MFTVSSAYLEIFRSRSRDLMYLVELYSWDYVPFPEGSPLSYDPRHAVLRLSGRSYSTVWDSETITYQRETLELSGIQKHIGKQFDSASIRVSNVSREMASFVLNNKVEGMRVVVRMMPFSAPVSESPTAGAFTDSIILFVGRAQKPDGFTRSVGTITARQDLGTIEAQIPPRQYQPPCPLRFKHGDCLGNQTLAQKTATYQAAKICNKTKAQCVDYGNEKYYGGTKIVQISSNFVYKHHWSFGLKLAWAAFLPVSLLFKRGSTTVGNSVHDGTPTGQPIPIILGRWWKKLIPLQYQDTGESIIFKMSACRGTIKDFLNIRNETPSFSQPTDIVEHLGEYGGVGTQTQDLVFPGGEYHSKLAYLTGRCTGSDVQVEDPAPEISSMIAGAVVRKAYGAQGGTILGTGRIDNVFASYSSGGDDWTDNPVDLSYYIITDPAILAIPTAHMGELGTAITSIYTLGAIKDVSNAERCILPDTETTRAGVDYKRYNSTGVIGPLSFFGTGLDFLNQGQRPGGIPDREAEYEFYEPDNPPDGFTVKTVYRKRYTANLEISEQKKAIDFLYDVLFPTFRGFLRWDHHGRMVIDCDRPADHSYLRGDAVTGATTVKVLDVTPWKPFEQLLVLPEPLRGYLLTGVSKLTSEVRGVTSASYSADGDAITLAASSTSGTMTAVASGPTLAGGSASVPSSGSVEIGGSCSVGDVISITIDGYEVSITATQEDVDAAIDNLTMACQLTFAINAEPRLKDYVEASRGGSNPTSVNIQSKFGVLNLESALEENHYAELADPTTAPTLAASAGALDAGTYLVAYAYRNANGNTNYSPISAITLTASQQIDVSTVTLPAGAVSIDWFVSVEANSGTMLRVVNNSGSAFSINSLPASTELDLPKRNTTGEEILRVMYSFAHKALTYANTTRANVLDDSFTWPEGNKQSTVNQVKGKHREAIQDFAEAPLVVNDERHQEETGQVNPVDLDLSAVDNHNQAKRLFNGYLAKLRDADFFFSWGSAGEALLLEVGDVVCASDDSGEWRNVPIRIEEPSYNSHFEISLGGRLYSTSQFDDEVLETEIPLPSALINYLSPPPDILFNTIDFPPNGLVQTTESALITTVRGGALFGASTYTQQARVGLKRPGESVFTEIARINPDSNLEAVFEFIASVEGTYTVQLEVCGLWGCNTVKPTASITVTFGALGVLLLETGGLTLTEGSDYLAGE